MDKPKHICPWCERENAVIVETKEVGSRYESKAVCILCGHKWLFVEGATIEEAEREVLRKQGAVLAGLQQIIPAFNGAEIIAQLFHEGGAFIKKSERAAVIEEVFGESTRDCADYNPDKTEWNWGDDAPTK